MPVGQGRRTLFAAVDQINTLISGVARLKDVAEDAAEEAVELMGEALLNNIKPFVPHDTGALEESGKVDVERRGTESRALVTFGGDTPIVGRNSPDGNVDYALKVHEDLETTFSQEKNPQAQAKFMEAGMAASVDNMQRILESALRGVFG